MVSSPIPPAGHIPPQFLETLVALDEGVTKTVASEKSASKKMAPVKAKAVTGLRQTLKKKTKEFEQVLATYKQVGEIVVQRELVLTGLGRWGIQGCVRRGQQSSTTSQDQTGQACAGSGARGRSGRKLFDCWSRWTCQELHRQGCSSNAEGDCRAARS